MTDPRSSSGTAGDHTPTPWFVSGVRFKMNGGEWHSIDRYDESKKQDENIACVGYDPRNGLGLADAHFIVKAVNAHADLVKALERMQPLLNGDRPTVNEQNIGEHWRAQNALLIDLRQIVDAALSQVRT